MEQNESKNWRTRSYPASGGGAVYGLGFIGAVVYYFQHAHGFEQFLFGFLKAIVWPALLIYKVLERLAM